MDHMVQVALNEIAVFIIIIIIGFSDHLVSLELTTQPSYLALTRRGGISLARAN